MGFRSLTSTDHAHPVPSDPLTRASLDRPSTCAPTTLSLALRSPGKNIKFIAAGSAACHSVAVDDEGTCYVWGRNEKGQLGLGDQLTRNVPTELTALKGVAKVVSAACGRYHTVFVTDTGDAYASGSNSSGQCGQGFVKKLKKGEEDLLLEPVKCRVSGCSKVAVGAEFTMWLCDGSLYSAGLPQYGQLGHGGFSISTDVRPRALTLTLTRATRYALVRQGPTTSITLLTARSRWCSTRSPSRPRLRRWRARR